MKTQCKVKVYQTWRNLKGEILSEIGLGKSLVFTRLITKSDR